MDRRRNGFNSWIFLYGGCPSRRSLVYSRVSRRNSSRNIGLRKPIGGLRGWMLSTHLRRSMRSCVRRPRVFRPCLRYGHGMRWCMFRHRHRRGLMRWLLLHTTRSILLNRVRRNRMRRDKSLMRRSAGSSLNRRWIDRMHSRSGSLLRLSF